MSEFEYAIKTLNDPPYMDPDVNPNAKPGGDSNFHDEDEFDDMGERSYGGWANPPYGELYYYLVMHTLFKNGVVPAPPRVRQAYEELDPDQQWPSSFYLDRMGWKVLGNHERSGTIRSFIENIGQHIDLEKYWLLPVISLDDYVSWDFVFVPRDEDTVLRQIIGLGAEPY